ncbi:MAG: GNAT family N-acetyltransferase [Bacteroidota bacterium]
MPQINFNPFPYLKTERLQLRPLTMQDENEIFALRSDERVLKYLRRPKAESIENARAFITKITNGLSPNKWVYWALEEKESRQLIGTICLWNISECKTRADIGFETLPNFQRKGYTYEAILLVLDYGFKEMKLKVIEAKVNPKNIKSIKLLEKSGFVLFRKDEKILNYKLTKQNYSNY